MPLLLFRRLAGWVTGRLPSVPALPVRLAMLAVTQALLAWGVVALTRETGRVAAAWPGCAVLLVCLLVRPKREWRWLLAASAGGIAVGSVLGEPSLLRAVVLGILGLGESLGSALWLRRNGARRPDLARPRSLIQFAVVLVLAPLASGLLAALFMSSWYGTSFAANLRTWSLAHALGLALVVPLLLALLRPGWRARLAPGGTLRALSYAGLLTVTCLLVFGSSELPGLFLVFPPLLLMVWRLGVTGAASGLVLVAAIALPGTLANHGPLAVLPGLAARVQYLQVFLLVLAATMLPVAALLAAHRRLLATQRYRAREVHRQASLLDSALSAMEQGLAAYDSRGRLLAANGRYAELLDLPPTLLTRGRPYQDVARHLAERGEFGPGDPEQLVRERLAFSSAGRHHRLTRVRPNGRGLEITGRPLPGGGWVTTVSDVTEQQQRERRLAESEASFRLLTENSGDVVARLGLDGRFSYASPAALRVLGWLPDALVYRRMMDFVSAEDRAWVASSFAALGSGEVDEATVTFRFHRADDSEAWLEAHARLGRSPDGAPQELVLALRDATDRKAAEAELLAAFEQMEAMAQTDGLTGLANRRRFDEMLNREYRRAAREGTALGLVLVDADRFKLFNDRYGHAAGDDCLRQVAVAVAGAARRPGDLAARYGGEEFVLLLPNTDLAGAAEVAERLRQDILAAGLVHAGNPPLGVMTVSLGVASVAPADNAAVDTDALLRSADAALYAAKAGGRNRVATSALAQAA